MGSETREKKPIWFYVEYNGKFVGMYRNISSALKLIERKGLKDDSNNLLRVIDNLGNTYDVKTGNKIC